MLLVGLIVLPLVAALVASRTPSARVRPLVVAGTGVLHVAGALGVRSGDEALGGWFAADPLGRLVLVVVSVLFTLCAVYGVGYLRVRKERPNLVFCVCLLTFLSMTTAIALAQHLAVVWVAVEGATLSTAVLVYFNHNARSLEAAWKYLVIGSVGIALALLGSLFVAYAALRGASGDESLLFGALLAHASALSRPWLRAGFVLLVVGYGTKMGLAPMHTWKPDVYGEAPGIIGALLAGGMTNCAFLALLRVYRVMQAAGEGAFARELFLGFGLASMAVAAAFMAGQRDFKRMLAYSSVEHMGILVVGIGVGGLAVVGALLHVVNNALTKGVLFLSAGNIHRAYGSKTIDKVSGALRRVPWSGALFLAGFFAITGSPPFGPFVSEFTILSGAMSERRFVTGALFLAFLAVVFIGMGATVLAVVQGPVSAAGGTTDFRDSFWRVAPILAALTMVVAMGVWIPDAVYGLVLAAAKSLEGAS
ncbi:MAG TPA: proton-conducting transporter membrane subunit [Thermoanaerobaculia bacterium]|nr:proton-conducting transporter membrane subunit [Thermoanaerobaculia bacterium]